MVICMQIVFVAPGSRGDVQPLLAVAMRLAERGDAVAFCCHDCFKEVMEGL